MQWQKKERKNHALVTRGTALPPYSPSPFPPPFPSPYQQGSGIGRGSHQCCMFPRTQTKKTWFQVQLMSTRTPSVWYTTPATTWTRAMPLSLSLSQSEFCHYDASKTDFKEWYYQDNDNTKKDRSLNKNDKSNTSLVGSECWCAFHTKHWTCFNKIAHQHSLPNRLVKWLIIFI